MRIDASRLVEVVEAAHGKSLLIVSILSVKKESRSLDENDEERESVESWKGEKFEILFVK